METSPSKKYKPFISVHMWSQGVTLKLGEII